jgi:hypothetical protein
MTAFCQDNESEPDLVRPTELPGAAARAAAWPLRADLPHHLP